MKASINISNISNSKAIRWISAGWSAFILENLIISNNRQKIINQIGTNNYIFCYSALSTVTTGSIIYGYIKYGRKNGPFLNKVTRSNLILGGFISLLFIIYGVMVLIQEKNKNDKKIEDSKQKKKPLKSRFLNKIQAGKSKDYSHVKIGIREHSCQR